MSGYVTRFAPSPTGLLHLGHAFSALTAFDAARTAGGQCLLRIEDIDVTRSRPAFEAAIYEDMAWLGLAWPTPVRRQSEHMADYRAALARLRDQGLLYRCFRTRREVLDAIASAPHGPGEDGSGTVFRGAALPPDEEAVRLARQQPFAWRLSIDRAQRVLGGFGTLIFEEAGQGPGGEHGAVAVDLMREGDVILARKDVGVAYHLAVVVDDALQGVSEVVRGADLFAATHVQRLLQALLGLATPRYRHHRLLLGEDGHRLAKRNGSPSLQARPARAGPRPPPPPRARRGGRPASRLRRCAQGSACRPRDLVRVAGGDRLVHTGAMPAAPDRKPLFVLLAGATVIGVGTVLVRLTGTGPASAGLWRLAFALPWMGLMMLGERRPADRPGAAVPPPGFGAPAGVMAVCGLLFAADLLSWHYSLKFTSIADSSVLANLTPVIVTVLAWIVFREAPAPVFLAGLGLAVAGAVTMAATRGGGRGVHPIAGDGLALLASFWYSLYFMAVRRARHTASALQVMTASTVIGAPLLLVAALTLRETLLPASLVGWSACVGLGLMHVGGQGAIAWALGKVPTALAAMVILIQPVVAAAAGWLVFREAVGPVEAIGAALALAGVAVAQLASRRQPLPPVAGEAEAAA